MRVERTKSEDECVLQVQIGVMRSVAFMAVTPVMLLHMFNLIHITQVVGYLHRVLSMWAAPIQPVQKLLHNRAGQVNVGEGNQEKPLSSLDRES